MKATSFKLSAKTMECIKSIQKNLEITSNTEVIRKAILLLDICSAASKKGDKIYIIDANGNKKEILLL